MEGLRDYAFVSMFVAHAADGTVGDAEDATILHNVSRAATSLGYNAAQVGALVRAVRWEYWDLLDDGPAAVLRRFKQAVAGLHRWFPDDNVLRAIHQDIARIAAADGHIDDMERFLLRQVRQQWESLRR